MWSKILKKRKAIQSYLVRLSIGLILSNLCTYHMQTSSFLQLIYLLWFVLVSTFRPRGVPGPTSKLSLRAPIQVGRRETEHKVEKNRGSCYPAPRADALAVGGYKRSRGREREIACSSARPPARPPSRMRALDLPFIDVRRGSRCTMGGVAIC
jgi:hypothetical protein